ncbi:hypothetical protein Ddye_026592 [Dipteronia dyeriana]|uniref:Uncharacterized protein n=1 Tax=Dipteronia dyeriana TaxID=168575 RepID=A0AAD9TMF8_9ROSI|nr:hypothetical protein Ddye_026592 [Dipteronia dyeriana]
MSSGEESQCCESTCLGLLWEAVSNRLEVAKVRAAEREAVEERRKSKSQMVKL